MVVFGIITNVLTTVGIVLLNKHLYSRAGFTFMVTLSAFHFIFTSISMFFFKWLKFFPDSVVNLWGVFPLCIGSCGSIVFMNLNLAHNSVGFYQISKLACIPLTLMLQYTMNGVAVSNPVKWSLVVILTGVGIATVTDIEMNFTGTLFALIAISFTTVAQIFTGTKQRELGLDALQLLYQSGPIISLGMVLAIPFLDNVWAALYQLL